MAYIGSTPASQGFIPGIDYFSGNGSTLAFTLSRNVTSVYQVEVVIDNVIQNPSSAFTVLNNTITFTSAPLTGTNNIWVEYVTFNSSLVQPGAGTVNTVQLGDINSISSSTSLSLKTNVGVERMRIDSAGNVGIGTSNPSAKLDILVSGATLIQSLQGASGVYQRIGTSTSSLYTLHRTTDSNIYTDNASPLWFGTNSTERMRIDSSGNVGIGTSSPSAAYKLDITGTVRATTGVVVTGGNSVQLVESTGNNSWYIKNNANTLSLNYNADVASMTIANSGNVGIGTSSPSYKLDIVSGDATAGLGYALRIRANTTAAAGSLQFTDNAATVQYAVIAGDSSSNLKFYSGLSEKMRIDSAGNLLVGTTSVQGIGTTITGSYMYQRASATAGVFRYTGGDTANNYVVYNQSNIGMYLTNGGSSWLASTSDARLKNKVSDIENALEAVQKLKALTFRYKKEDQNITPRYGFFAQNVGEAIPDAMIISPEKDENIDGDIYTYDAAIINVYMVKAIQELKAIIDTQQTTIVELQSDIKELKGVK